MRSFLGSSMKRALKSLTDYADHRLGALGRALLGLGPWVKAWFLHAYLCMYIEYAYILIPGIDMMFTYIYIYLYVYI